ncbi:hypothetical protein Halha_0977 [Halobacteroides halobius DSM 5150]|uniref:DUF445 family protein n=1 Tax=Halobacteroides halobius (strain ATCC 35273 / DSM 5150 / MD-1) TaxID=748449 RepID=L0KA08_HALHC|nr:DUF445 family protein [Halobacteroides halobius]AGB40938.1 hypothetical protein Halha_0977 [Halobacteroides halobius DSM 5150]
MDPTFIISPIVGAIIGYFTNWLAIKMLFKPLTKKEFFGIKIPFTPGVIPRRREKLAKSIGGAVGNRLLTPDAFQRLLQDKEVEKKVREFIRLKLRLLEEEERSLKQILSEVFSKGQVEKLQGNLEGLFIKLTTNLISEEKLVSWLDNFFTRLDKEQLESYLDSESYLHLKEELIDQLDSTTIKQAIFLLLKANIEEAKNSEQELAELLPSEVVIKLKEWLAQNEPQLTEQIIEFFTSDSIKEKIDQKLEGLLGDNPLMGMLGGIKNSIVDKFLRYLIEFLEDPENRKQVKKELNKFLDSLLKTKVATIANKIDEENLSKLADKITNYIVANQQIEVMIDTLEELALENINNDDLNDKIKDLSKKLICSKSSFLSNKIKKFITTQTDSFLKQPLTLLLSNLFVFKLEELEAAVISILEYIIENQLGEILSIIDFKEMVKRKIDSFNILEVERLLLDVIETELKAITWFGAILGLMMGLITPIISLLTG